MPIVRDGGRGQFEQGISSIRRSVLDEKDSRDKLSGLRLLLSRMKLMQHDKLKTIAVDQEIGSRAIAVHPLHPARDSPCLSPRTKLRQD